MGEMGFSTSRMGQTFNTDGLHVAILGGKEQEVCFEMSTGDGWFGGFAHNVGIASAVVAELRGVSIGLTYAQDLGLCSLILEFDSETVMRMTLYCSIHVLPMLEP